MASDSSSLTKAADVFSDTRPDKAQQICDVLNQEKHRALRISAQQPAWKTFPEASGEPLRDRGGLKEGQSIFLPLYLPLATEAQIQAGTNTWAAISQPTLLEGGTITLTIGGKEHGQATDSAPAFHLTGKAHDEFVACQRKMVALGLIEKEEDARLVLNQKPIVYERQRSQPPAYTACLGVDADKVDTTRLAELREHFTRSEKVVRLIDHAFGLENAGVTITPPTTREERATIVYQDLSVGEFSTLVEDNPFSKWAGDPLEAQSVALHSGLPRGMSPLIASFVYGGAPREAQAMLSFDAEDPGLYTKALRLSVLRDFTEMAGADKAATLQLVGTMQDIAEGKDPPAEALPGVVPAKGRALKP